MKGRMIAATVLKKRNKKNADTFLARYAKCNNEQKEAIDRIEGPVMVIAGPGTGKTEILALRVANILKNTHMRPSNILCLTFSTSGAQAMRERLRFLIDSDAYGVTVNTVHGFCNDVLGSYPAFFENLSAMENISDVERVREMNKIIDQKISHMELLNQKYPYMRTTEILHRISQLKREGIVKKEHLIDVVDLYGEHMKMVSKPGTKVHERALSQAKKFRDFIELFFAYEEMMSSSMRYDYEDMILMCNHALRSQEWMLQSYQERYQYILVDEFQDLNGAQCDVIELLTTSLICNHEPNLFVVGDDDQAIYRFQGANVANILKFRQRFPSAHMIALKTSYRCCQRILDAAGSLISHNTERLVGKIDGLSKDLLASDTRMNKKGHVFLIFSSSETTETHLIADLVQSRIKQGVRPNEIAVLTQTNRELALYEDVLRERGVSVSMKGKRDLLAHPIVNQVIAVLKAVANPCESAVLAHAFACECFDIHPADLGRLYCRSRESHCSLFDLLLTLDDAQSNSVSDYFYDKEKVINTRNIIFDLHHKLGSRTVVNTLEHLLKECGFLSRSHTQNPHDFVALQEFFNRIKMRAYEQKHFSFESFLSDISYYQDGTYPDLRMTYEVPMLSRSGVQLMTAHQSKGLEFDIVILPGFREGHWDQRRRPPSISLPEDLLFGWNKDQKSYEQSQDERRVAYVGMTRARDEVIFTCPKERSLGNSVKPVSASRFVAECGDVDEEKNIETFHPIHRESIKDFDLEFKSFLLSRLENFSLSVTALNHFLEDPSMFLECDLLQVPQSKKPNLVYGNAVHWALRTWGMNKQRGEPSNKEKFFNDFCWYLNERELLTEKEKSRLIRLGEESLPTYFDACLRDHSCIVHKVEDSMHARFGDIPLKGKIDRIDLEDLSSARAIITDYKTGRLKTEREIKEGDYFRQLVFYALLFKHSSSMLKPSVFILDFIGERGEAPTRRIFNVLPSEIKDMEGQIKSVWKKIMKLDFSPL